MRGHGKCAASDEIRRRVLLDEQRGQADQNHQRKGCQPQRLVRTQRRRAKRHQMQHQRLIAVQARKHVDRRIVRIDEPAKRPKHARPLCRWAKVDARRVEHKHGYAQKRARKQCRRLPAEHVLRPQTRPEHTPRHIKIPQDVKHDERRTKRDPVIERQVHDMVAQTDVLRRKIRQRQRNQAKQPVHMPIF